MASKRPRPSRRVTGAWGMEMRSQIAVWLLAMTGTLAALTAIFGSPVTLRPTVFAVMAVSHAVIGFMLGSSGSRNAGFSFCGAWVLGATTAVLLIAGGLNGYAFAPAAAYLSCAVAAALLAAATIHERFFWRRIRTALGGTP